MKHAVDSPQIKCEDLTMRKIKVGNKSRYSLTKKECLGLFEMAEKAIENTFPNGNSGYAVAVLTNNRKAYTGVSYISDTDTLTMHSEATALAHAAIHGEKEVVAITGPNCHICKQLIYENSLRSDIDIVIITKEKGSFKQTPISKLMPYPWPDKPVQKKLSNRKLEKFKKVKF